MRLSGRFAAIALALLSVAALLLFRGRLRELALRLRLAFLLADGARRLVSLAAFAVVAPCVALAWHDLFAKKE